MLPGSVWEHLESVLEPAFAPRDLLSSPLTAVNIYPSIHPSIHPSIYRPRALAGSQLCCALDPPRHCLCLRMAYRVPYSNPPSLPSFLMIYLSLYMLSFRNSYGGAAACPPARPRTTACELIQIPLVDFCSPRSLQDASSSPSFSNLFFNAFWD